MASLKSIQAVLPTAATIAGRVIAYHKGKHIDLGQYVDVDTVVLSSAGEACMAGESPWPEKKPATKKPAKLGLDAVDL